MKRTLGLLLLGVAVGLVSHFGWLSVPGPRATRDLTAQLAWMKSSLALTDAQLARIKALHEESAPHLQALATRVERARAELAAFEHDRKEEGRIDFLEFARFVEKRRELDRECTRSTEQLVAAAAEVMTPQQREQYLNLLGPALRPRSHSSG